ncbi:DUF4322 domain-containing protein [Sulfolobus sp. S-194]|uniref:DUF4322 domain-containing protein n=1 Tax=Sulfolobus sp. S-194 TaxID=2512240 RepID=UPI001436D22A|nr:DUF4322 domain-containing protein [Sulfolobus sp. S-194]QIW22856.1 DUF4322 domain-containing protein [Sulfolobus sp. S-194]
MITPSSPNQVKNKLSSILNFKGRKAEQAKQVIISAAITRDSIENKAKKFSISPQTARNYIEQTTIDKMTEKIKKLSIKKLKKRIKNHRPIKISIDWTSIEYYGKPVEGIGGSKQGYAWNYATATTQINGKTLVLALTRITKGMSKADIVKTLIEQVLALGVKISLVTLDAGFYSVDVLKYLSQFKFVVAVPVGDVKVHHDFDGIYRTRSKGKDRVAFRLIVHHRVRDGKREYFAKGTNLDLPKYKVVRLYNEVRTPIETSYRMVKSFLIFTSSRSWVFRLFVFVLAILIYMLFMFVKGKMSREDFRLFLILLFLFDNINYFYEYSFNALKSLFNTLDLFSRG